MRKVEDDVDMTDPKESNVKCQTRNADEITKLDPA